MSDLRLEIGESSEATRCECCGGTSRTAFGFVYRNDDAHAVYYAGWTDEHPERGVSMAIAVGEWTEGSSPADRVSIGLRAWASPSSVNFTVLNSGESPWGDTALLGQMLERDQALGHPLLSEVMRIAEHIVRDDARVNHLLGPVERAGGGGPVRRHRQH